MSIEASFLMPSCVTLVFCCIHYLQHIPPGFSPFLSVLHLVLNRSLTFHAICYVKCPHLALCVQVFSGSGVPHVCGMQAPGAASQNLPSPQHSALSLTGRCQPIRAWHSYALVLRLPGCCLQALGKSGDKPAPCQSPYYALEFWYLCF